MPNIRSIHSIRSRIAGHRAALAEATAELSRALAYVCPKCGRKASEKLTLSEANELQGYGNAECMSCLMTDVVRPPEEESKEQTQ